MSQSFVVGTPPTSRRVSPAPRRRASADQRNSVVPFTRPGSSGRLADSQNNSFERNFRPSVPTQSQSQPVVSRPSFSKLSFDSQTPQQVRSSSRFPAPSKPADSHFSRQEGFAASAPHPLADRGSQAVLTSPFESPDRAKSTSLLSQQLNRESSVSLAPADVKVWQLPYCLSARLRISHSCVELVWLCCRGHSKLAMIFLPLYPQALKRLPVWRIYR